MKVEETTKKTFSRLIQSNNENSKIDFVDNRQQIMLQNRYLKYPTLQRQLIINSSPKSPFNKLTHKEYKTLKNRIEIPYDSWVLLKNMAASEGEYKFITWVEALKKAPYVSYMEHNDLNKPMNFAKEVVKIRSHFAENKDIAENKRLLSNLVSIYNKGKKKTGVKPQFKSPETNANKLIMFNSGIDSFLSEKFDIENVAENFNELYPDLNFESALDTVWAEDHFNYFDNSYSTNLPVSNFDDFLKKMMEEREVRGSQITNPSYTMQSGIIPQNSKSHIFLRSVVDGGNMLPAPDFAIIGKDSLVATKNQNGMNEEEAKMLIADDYGYEVNKLCFVEQPHYHIDLMIMLLGRNKIMVKEKNNEKYLKLTIDDLQKFNNPRLEVIVDNNEIAGKQNEKGEWEYNFFNGEYVYGKDNELYYVTNGAINEKAQENFRELMKEKTKVKDVIFSSTINSQLLNSSHGGLGCRFKGAKI